MEEMYGSFCIENYFKGHKNYGEKWSAGLHLNQSYFGIIDILISILFCVFFYIYIIFS